MNTTRGDRTDDVVNMNNVKLVIIGDKGCMAAPLFNTTPKGRHNNEKTRENARRG